MSHRTAYQIVFLSSIFIGIVLLFGPALGLPASTVGSGSAVMNLHVTDFGVPPNTLQGVTVIASGGGTCLAASPCMTDNNGNLAFLFTPPLGSIMLTKTGYNIVTATMSASCSTCNYIVQMAGGSATASETLAVTQTHVVVKDSVTGVGIATASITASAYSQFFSPTYTSNTAGDYYLGQVFTTLPQGTSYTITVSAPSYETQTVTQLLTGSPPTAYVAVSLVSSTSTTSSSSTTSSTTSTTTSTTSTTSTTTTTTTSCTVNCGSPPFSLVTIGQYAGVGFIGVGAVGLVAKRKEPA